MRKTAPANKTNPTFLSFCFLFPFVNTDSFHGQRTVMESFEMRRGSSHQSVPKTEDRGRRTVASRRNSFSSFLTRKYAKRTEREAQQVQTKEKLCFKKGHRPRSFSELPAVPSSVERAPPVAATIKTPIYEYYGFVMYLASFVVLGIYLIWAYVSDDILHGLGITYYPNRYWALAVPIWLMTVVWMIFFSFMAINLMNTAAFDSYACITDEHANVMQMQCPHAERPEDWMPELHDIPISLVSALLYDEAAENQVPQELSTSTSDEASVPVIRRRKR
ncbi:PIG-P-domain-containing protein [Radiomyces spectabilis]|uniref:PIG-P-domain-containing protein n=1 Tax=Radiomyces spectabilis TaxID=64574 RepID=UPI00221F2B2E|nr:PIG-P-domain-containing protein [Radiomyces spectabilis]KAI8367499.1 PIG-P-domain-containing protein [Radiomyces spectabilis]